MRIGVDYYPEQWDRGMWEKDAALMARCGVKLVRIGVGAWSKIEPRDGEFDLSWLDEVIGIFSRFAIGTVLCTPISSPPAWLFQAYPEIIPTGAESGQSRKVCINSQVFRGYSKRIASVMIRHYSGNPAIAAWQIGVKSSPVRCRCGVCREKFRNWLISEYDSLNGINNALGYSGFGGYSDISQIQPPEDRAGEDPALSLEWHHFVSECETDLIRELMLTIRLEDTRVPITADIASVSDAPDVYKLCDLLDFVGCDNYPPVRIPEDGKLYSNSFRLDLMRGIKKRHFWVMEQLSGASCTGGIMTPAPVPGMIMGYSLQAMMHGADAVIHYRWRTALSGRDMFRHGILDHSGVPDRRFHEFSELCRIASQLDILDNTDIVSDAAILYSPESDAAFRIQPQTEGFSYIGQLEAFHSALTRFGANVDIVSPEADLSGYKLVIAPSLYINISSVTENIYRYVISGGTVVLTLRSGVKDESNNCIMDTLPTVFKELIGAEITAYDPIGSAQGLTMRDFAGNEFRCGEWCDIIQTGTARAYAEYADGEYRCMPAVTMNRYCGGVAYYVGTVCGTDFCESFISNLMMQTGIPRLKGLPQGVEVTTRTNGRDEFICFFNNSGEDAVISLPKPMFSVLSSTGKERLELRPFEMDIIRK